MVLFFSWSISLKISHSEYHDRRSIIGTLCSKKMTEWRTPIEILFEIRTSELIAGKRYFLLENPSFSHKTLKFSQGLRPWTPLTHLVSGFAAHDLRQPKSVFTFRAGPKSAFPSDDPPTPGGYTLRHLRQIYHFSLAPSAPIILLLCPVIFFIF